jgi:hypothetical protein
VGEPFLSYWQANGGVRIFGYPISARFTDENGLVVQWFERARMELHPHLPPGHQVLLGRLGHEALRRASMPYYEVTVHDLFVPDVDMEFGFAQGGESDDPAFFDNVRQAGSRLGTGLLRLDNIFNYYNIVQRTPDGLIRYNWHDFDRVLDAVLAMGKEPFICLSYMPEVISVDGRSRVVPPLDYRAWAELVKATVTHVNVERKLGVRYWEVWNEPDQWSFWQAPYAHYLHLYDVSVEAALAADPNVLIGGPAIARFSADHLHEFLQHQARRGSAGRVDFLSWHSYGQSPLELASHIRTAREILAHYPQFAPKLFITEFNVRQGGAGDTSANGYTDTAHGAVEVLSAIEVMRRERLDGALLFGLKDGRGPREYWGRWGLLTYNGHPKPLYHVIRAYQQRPDYAMPVRLTSGALDGSLGVMAFGSRSPSRSLLLVWYRGPDVARVRLVMPPTFAHAQYSLTLFDSDDNNPALSGVHTVRQFTSEAGDLVLEMEPYSVVVVEQESAIGD